MNTQILNRMIKASYYAPNGAQLRKACYSLLSVNSRRASSEYMTMEQISQLPEEVQMQVKTEVAKTAIAESSKAIQNNLARYGLKDIKVYIHSEGLNEVNITQGIKQLDPMLKKVSEQELKSVPKAIQITSDVLSSSSVEEAVSHLPPRMADIIQAKFEGLNYIKYILLCVLIYYFMGATSQMVDIINDTPGLTVGLANGILFTFMGVSAGVLQAVYFLLHYFFGDIFKWINKRIGMIVGWVASLVPRAVQGLLDAFGGGITAIKGALSRFFSRQAKIAMQSPEFRRAYYSI